MEINSMYYELITTKKFRYIFLALIAVVPLELLSFFDIHLPSPIEFPLFLIFIAAFGYKVFWGGLKSLMRLRFSNINLLMTIAVTGAVYLQQFEEAAVIIVLFALSEALEDYGRDKSKSAIEELVNKNPKTVTLKAGQEVKLDDVKIGDIFLIRHGDHIALDGEVVAGESLVDESAITGEPLPKNKYPGDTVFSGSVATQGYLEGRATRVAKDTTLAKIIQLTYSAIEKKSQSQRFIEQFASYYTPTVMVLSLGVFVIPVFFLHLPATIWLTEALTLLIISCPCALVISTPVGVFSALGNATKRGALIKGGRFLEELGKVKAIAFDKTRTLTKGEVSVSDIVPYGGSTREGVLSCLAGMEAFSEHPIAQSIVRHAKSENMKTHGFTGYKATSGKGITGTCLVCSDAHHCAGSLKFIAEEHGVDDRVTAQVEAFGREGKTSIVVSDGQSVSGIVAVSDEIKEESKSTIRRLKALGVTPVMLTGDAEAPAQFVARQVGISEVHASLLPEQKVSALSLLTKKYTSVAMVGDGVNDAPALAASSVGIAMGAAGSDVAIENADIALLNDKISLLPYLIQLGRKTSGIIRFNIISAVSVKLLFIALAITGYSTLALAIFADVGVTVLVILNALRLYGWEEELV